MDKYYSGAGGKILCLRCTAKSSRTGLQCGRPALTGSATNKCQFHGGRGSGPKTVSGKARIAELRTLHGRASKEVRAKYSAASARMSRLEDACYVLGIVDGPRSRGRKAIGYTQVRTLEDIKQMLMDELSHSDEGTSGLDKK